jgi:hypothetical protein
VTISSRPVWVHGSTWGTVGSGTTRAQALVLTAIRSAVASPATSTAPRRSVTEVAPITVRA